MADLELPYFKFYVRDWLADQDITMLSLEQQGALLRLRCSYWAKGSLPPEPENLARIVSVPLETFERLWPALEPFFEARDDGRLVDPELQREREKLLRTRRKQSKAGKETAAKRFGTSTGESEVARSPSSSLNSSPNSSATASSKGRGHTTDGSRSLIGEDTDRRRDDGSKGYEVSHDRSDPKNNDGPPVELPDLPF